jgi:hypothetical protein
MVKQLMLPALLFSAFTAAAVETAENFNSRNGVPIQNLKSNLQNSCWTFHNFDVNQNGWNPQLEGDGAMVSNADAIKYSISGIYTPVLNVASVIDIAFEYTFSEDFSSSATRKMRICLLNANNELVQVLDQLDFIGLHAKLPKKYNTQFKNITAGEYRLALLYSGTGEAARIAVDDLKISAPAKYVNGCNVAPIMLKAKVTGRPDRTAFGSLLINDKDVNEEKLTAYLIKNSDDGNVQLNPDGTFVFEPNKGFEGTSTSFVYKVCDEGAGNLCSGNSTVYIDFPKASVSLVDFKGAYKYNGNVELVWNTAADNHTAKFELERSFDGRDWEKAGTVQNKADVNVYAYIDYVGKGTAHRRDLFYRLKQTNTDGSVLMSRLLIVRVYNTKTLTMISVTPNPVKNDITANVQLNEDSYVSMRVLNSSGNAVIFKTVEGTTGLNTFTVDGTSKLQAGSYMLELIVNSKERMLVKLLKE